LNNKNENARASCKCLIKKPPAVKLKADASLGIFIADCVRIGEPFPLEDGYGEKPHKPIFV
jgi:hypothetical protein